MQLRCKHKERLENKEIFPSVWEQMTPEERARLLEIVQAEPAEWMFRRKVVMTYICNECGRRQTQTEQSMEEPF